MTPYLDQQIRERDFLLAVGRRAGLDQAHYHLERAYIAQREAAYAKDDTAQLRWAAESDRRIAAELHADAMRFYRNSLVTFLAAAVLFVAALMTRG